MSSVSGPGGSPSVSSAAVPSSTPTGDSVGNAAEAASSSSAGAAASTSAETAYGEKPLAQHTGLVMQIVVRRDLMTTLDWPLGPLMAQAAHAACAVQHVHASDPNMAHYLAGTDGRGYEVMRKTILEVEGESELLRLAKKLDRAGAKHVVWIEEPEHIPTALALVPNKRPKSIKRALDDVGAKLWA